MGKCLCEILPFHRRVPYYNLGGLLRNDISSTLFPHRHAFYAHPSHCCIVPRLQRPDCASSQRIAYLTTNGLDKRDMVGQVVLVVVYRWATWSMGSWHYLGSQGTAGE